MKKYRSAALALAACAASLSVAACSTGSPASSSSAPGQQGPSVATSAPAIPGRMLTVKGSLGTFPVPAGAKVGENMDGASSIIIVFGAITPSDVSRFYATALPKAGFTVTTNTMLSKDGSTGAIIEFNGHGFKGDIEALDKLAGPDLAGVGNTNVTTIFCSATKSG